MHRRYQVYAASLFCLVLFGSSAAAAGRVVTLSEALELAFQGNHELRATANGVEARRAETGIAWSNLLPQVSFEERFMRTNNPTYAFMAKLNQGRFTQQDFAIDALNTPQPVNDFQTSVSFQQAVFAPKALIGHTMAREEFSARSSEYARKREEVAFGVFRVYIGVQTARAFLAAAEKGVEDAREHHRLADVRYRSGLGLYSDLLRADVAVAAAEERRISARKGLDVARRSLGLMLGLEESVDASEERPKLTVKDEPYYRSASRSRHDVAAMEARYRNAENALRMANSGYLPFVGVGGSYQMNDHRRPFGTEGDSWQMMAFLRWELFDGTKREHERARAKSSVAEAGEYREGLKKQVSLQVYEAYLSVDEAAQGLDLARKSLGAAEEGRRLVRVRYENALSSLVDLLDVQAGLDGARAGLAEKEGAYLVAIANLGYQSGTIVQDLEAALQGGRK